MIDLELLNKAILLTQKEDFDEAEKIYLNLLEQEPENGPLLSAFGLFYVNIGNFEKASCYLTKACEIKETLGTVSALGFCEYQRGRFAASAEILEHALGLGETPEIYTKLINSLFEIRNYKKAIEYSAKMHQLYPENPESVLSMIKSLTYSGKLAEAEIMCVNYLKEHQNAAAFWFQLGFLKELIYSDDNQAFECYKVASELGQPSAYYNMAVSLQKQGKHTEAEEYYKKTLEIFPNDENTIVSYGMCQLAQRKFKEGYELFFQREGNNYKIGEPFEDEIVVRCEQGFGDHVQFIRYLPFLKQHVKKVYVATREPLMELFKKNYPDIEFILHKDINPKMQSVRIADLAYILGIDFDNIPFSEGYLNAETAEIKSDKLKVGLCWEAGSAGIRTMINRTINIRLFEDILNMENIQIYSFQVQDTLKGNERYPQMINLSSGFKNFEDTAKALKAMDVVISVDTSVAHLSGALGVKTFLMLPYAADWRWFNDTKTTPWYKSVEIFKQDDPISWEKPFGDIICRLNEYSS